MIATTRFGTVHSMLAIFICALTGAAACSQVIEFTWTSEGTFSGTPSGGIVDTIFSSSIPFDLTEFHASYTGVGGAMRTFGPFEITAASGDKLFGDFEAIFPGPVGLGVNIGNGPFTFTGGTGQFAGATGQGNTNVTTTLDRFPTTTGTVVQEWQGSITLVSQVPLQAGDADQDLDFDQFDLIQVQQAAKYLTGQAATWGEGDWNGAPGGSQGSPPTGNRFFDQLDIIAALAPAHYLTGRYAAIATNGNLNDEQTSIIYNPMTGELGVNAPVDTQLTSINIDSAVGIFTGQPAQNLGGSFDIDADDNIFKATFGSSFGSLSFGNVAQPSLAEEFLLGDLSVIGSLQGGGALGDVDLIYVPEPSTIAMAFVGLFVIACSMRRTLGNQPATERDARQFRRRIMSRQLTLVLSSFAICITASYGQAGEVVNETMMHNGLRRAYSVYVPDSYTGNEPWPMVINMHGATSNRNQQMNISRMNLVADSNDFIVVYPDAVGGLWNDVQRDGRPDDISFLGSLIDELKSTYAINESKVYATGLSQGAAMSYLLAHAMPERIAAIAPVAGYPPYKDSQGPMELDPRISPTTARPLPLMLIHGTNDPVVPPSREVTIPVGTRPTLPTLQTVLDAWLANNGCETVPTTSDLPDKVASDGPSTVQLRHFANCETYTASTGESIVAEVLHYQINGGGHTWPGGSVPISYGATNYDINASQEIWNFFSRHQLPMQTVQPLLQAGDADRDLDFDQLDLVQVQIAAKYLTGQPATWGEGDWNGAPGGDPDNPPAGNALFDQFDVIAALAAGSYLTGPYASLAPGGLQGDGQTSIVYDAASGAVSVDPPAGVELTSINMDSANGIFTGSAAENLGGSFDNDADDNIFKATFGSSFGSLTFGNVAQSGLSESFLLTDLTVIGSLAGGGDLGNVDLIYVPEPSALVLMLLGFTLTACTSKREIPCRT